MFLKELGSFGWTLMAGGASVVAAGGYGAINFFGRNSESQEKIKTLRNWFQETVKDNEGISSAQYVAKNERDESTSICGKWASGKASLLDPKDCEKLVQEKWSKDFQKQPVVWFESKDDNSMKHAISSYFDNGNSHFMEVKEEEGNWKYGGLVCSRVNSESTEGKIQVNCNHSN
ncbi:hypothetical protein [Mycoplasma suis]|uniref:Uncharacterized protein n=1 Tax=Mycoplasma suis (strain Illinois) TaxID=768700 RepID=F0QQJ7_MYCSL|nr:hypothetical protein [Mycoplasma suis]ADX97767.1 hypothetical protein MSU_0223 [Mycoplasma suis str. Illinois]